MASLANQTISSTYDGLIKTSTDQPVGVSGVQLLEDGVGNTLALSVGRANQGVTVTGTLTATAFSGDLTGDVTGNLTGNVTGDVTGDLTGTVLTAAQTNITSVGTLSTLAVSGNLTVDTDTLVVDSTNNRVGIGESNPSHKLTFSNTAARLSAIDHSFSSPDTFTDIISAGVGGGWKGNIRFFTSNNGASTERMRINHNGRVGIGTSSPDELVHIHSGDSGGSANVQADEVLIEGSNDTGITISSPSTYAGALAFGDNDSSFRGALIYNHPDDSMQFRVASNERMRIDSSGNVKIGDANPDITSTLTVSSNGLTNVATFMYDGAAGTYFDIDCEGADGIVALKADARSGAYPPLSFVTGGSERMRIDSSGNVGIGTSSPSELMVLAATNSQNVSNNTLRFEDLDTGAQNSQPLGKIEWYSSDNNEAGVKGSLYVNGYSDGRGGQMIFDTQGSASNACFFSFTNNSSEILRVSETGINILGGASALDDYEEGTWTMGISFDLNSVGVTYSRNQGTYTKIGRQVTVTGYLTLSNKGTSTGNARITGLPFSIPDDNAYFASAAIGYMTNISFADMVIIYGAKNSTLMDFYEITNAGDQSTLTNANFANNSSIIFTMTYFV